MNVQLKKMIGLLFLLNATACTTINVDHIQLQEVVEVNKGDTMVVLGRHQSAEFETEGALVRCLGNKLKRVAGGLNVLEQNEFVDSFYPWFESRTAPLHPDKLRTVLEEPLVAWEDTSDYETTIWYVETFTEVGRISTEAVGTSYMPAIVVPIPLLAQVQGDACQGMGNQLVKFFQDNSTQ